jgi:hypothetical protein
MQIVRIGNARLSALMNRRLNSSLAIIFLVLTVACAAAPADTSAGAPDLPLKAIAVPLNTADRGLTEAGRLRYRGGIELTSGNRLFGGLSGLDVAADGKRLIAMSDNGRWVSLTLTYDKGQLAGAINGVMKPIRRLPGYDRPGNWRDAESIAQDGSGGYYVAFERQHRIWHYRAQPHDPIDAEPVALKGPDDIDEQPANGGIEGLTRLCDRRLLALSEDALGPTTSTTKAWVFDGKSWKSLSYAKTGNFHPTDAATLPDCNVVVLERSFALPEGPRARLVLVPAKTIRPGATLRGEELAMLLQPDTVDNMEGITARKGENGETLIYIVSDNNFSPLQRTLLMMFELLPLPEKKK